jgi:hypothetical protein
MNLLLLLKFDTGHHIFQRKIEKTLLKIYRMASQQKLPTNIIANSLAEELFGADTAVY